MYQYGRIFYRDIWRNIFRTYCQCDILVPSNKNVGICNVGVEEVGNLYKDILAFPYFNYVHICTLTFYVSVQ
jgi:hypothetical protein